MTKSTAHPCIPPSFSTLLDSHFFFTSKAPRRCFRNFKLLCANSDRDILCHPSAGAVIRGVDRLETRYHRRQFRRPHTLPRKGCEF